MDLFGKIRDEHKIIIGTMVDLIGSDPLVRRERMDDLVNQISAHIDAEERSIYRAFEELDAIPRSFALRHEEEHNLARVLMDQLLDRSIPDERWAAKLQVLRDLIEQHIGTEERTMFDMAKDYFADEEINRMTKQFEEVETILYEEKRTGPIIRR